MNRQAVIEGLQQLEIAPPKALEEDIRVVLAADLTELKSEQDCLHPHLAQAIQHIWSSREAKEAVLMSHEFQLTEYASLSGDLGSATSLGANYSLATALHRTTSTLSPV